MSPKDGRKKHFNKTIYQKKMEFYLVPIFCGRISMTHAHFQRNLWMEKQIKFLQKFLCAQSVYIHKARVKWKKFAHKNSPFRIQLDKQTKQHHHRKNHFCQRTSEFNVFNRMAISNNQVHCVIVCLCNFHSKNRLGFIKVMCLWFKTKCIFVCPF